MDELFRQVVITLRGMWNYRWFGLATAWIVGFAAFVVILALPAKYEASARIFVNTESILRPLMTGLTVQPNDDQRIVMLSRVVISRPNVEKLVQATGLDAEAKTKEDREKVVDGVMKSLEIKGVGRENLYTLTFRDVDAARAQKAIEQLASMFIESSKGGKAADTEAAKQFIDEQIAVYEKKLQDAENRLKAFRLRYLGMTPGEGKDYFARMAETNAQLTQAQLELREAENTRDAFRRAIVAEEPVPGPASAAAPSGTAASIAELDARLEVMRKNLDVMLQRYTESHPDVLGTKRVIRELEEQRQVLAAQRRREGAPPVSATLAGPRASETLKVSLAQAEAQVGALRTRVAEFSARYERLKQSASLIPQVEAEYAQLNRDYDVNKKNYESLVGKRESASISSEMQSVAGVSDFRLIDPPRVSPRPVSPNRRILFPAALFLAIAAGFGAAFVAREARPTFFDGRSLREATGLPILGVVSMIQQEAQKLRARASLVRFAGGVGALVGAYLAGFIALELLAAHVV